MGRIVGTMDDLAPGTQRKARSAPWEPWGFRALCPGAIAELFLWASPHHSALVKAALVGLTALLVAEGVSLAFDYRGAAHKVARMKRPRGWSKYGGPWSPFFNRQWGILWAAAAVFFTVRGWAVYG